MYELKLNNTTIPLKWGTWAMREFCIAKSTINDKGERQNLPISRYFEILGNPQYDLELIVLLIYIGYKSACISNKTNIEYNENDICDWIDEIGGVFDDKGSVIEYVKYIISTTVITVQGNTPKSEKKKSSKVRLG
jgi:hypothetical protein